MLFSLLLSPNLAVATLVNCKILTRAYAEGTSSNGIPWKDICYTHKKFITTRQSPWTCTTVAAAYSKPNNNAPYKLDNYYGTGAFPHNDPSAQAVLYKHYESAYNTQELDSLNSTATTAVSKK